jgi:hypothetical protein
MPLSAFREELISQVDPSNEGHSEGRDAYRSAMEAIGPNIQGRTAEVKGLAIRIIKGMQQLHIPSAKFTTQGMATADGELVDCRAALVRLQAGTVSGSEYDYKRYSGKDSAHVTRLLTSYSPTEKQFTIAAPATHSGCFKDFDTSILYPRDGELVNARFGDDVLEGVLEQGPLTEHIRHCLAHFEERVPMEELHVLLPHSWFRRESDTRQDSHPRIQTLFTDGAQVHGMNENSPHGPQVMDAFRSGMVLGGEDFPPCIEDLVHQARIVTDKGEKPIFFQSLTPRCLVTQRDIVTGAVSGEQKQWLRKNRPLRPWDNAATMGANIDLPPHGPAVTGEGVVSVGDTLTVETEKTDWRM